MGFFPCICKELDQGCSGRGSDFVKDLSGIMRRLKISGPVGVAGSREMTQEVYSGIKKEVDLQMADDMIEEIAKEKTEREIEIIRKVARIADVGSDAFVNVREWGSVSMNSSPNWSLPCAPQGRMTSSS